MTNPRSRIRRTALLVIGAVAVFGLGGCDDYYGFGLSYSYRAPVYGCGYDYRGAPRNCGNSVASYSFYGGQRNYGNRGHRAHNGHRGRGGYASHGGNRGGGGNCGGGQRGR